MYLSNNRLKSFTAKRRKWPHRNSIEYKATPDTLSDAGFYFSPSKDSPDNVTCFLCHKSIEGWEPNDDPIDEHFVHSPTCAWVICLYKNKINWDDEDQWPTSKNMEEVRLKTFGKWWPHDGKKGWNGTSKKMAKAGFYFNPSYEAEDHVTCMYCNVKLEGWEPKDDPTHEHHKRISHCPFFGEPPPKSKRGKSTSTKKPRRNRKVMEDGIEVVDLTSPRPVKKNRRLNNNVNVGEIKGYNLRNARINESSDIININEEVVDEPQNVIGINEHVEFVEKNEFDGQIYKVESNEEEIDKLPNNTSINKECIDEQVNNNNTSEEEINVQTCSVQTKIVEQVDNAQTNEEDRTKEIESVEQVNNAQTNEEDRTKEVEFVEQMDNSQTNEEDRMKEVESVEQVDNSQTNEDDRTKEDESVELVNNAQTNEDRTKENESVEQVDNAQTNEEDRTKDESVEQVNNSESNGGIDKLTSHIKTQEIEEKLIFSSEEGINKKLNNISKNEERNNIMCQEELDNIIIEEEELNDIIMDEINSIFFTAVEERDFFTGEEERENVIINKEEQNNVTIDENIIINVEGRINIVENEEKFDIIVNKEPNNMITDEKERNIIMDKEENNIIDEGDINMQIDNAQSKRIEQVNHIESNEKIYEMDDIITNEGKLNNEEKLDEQNIFGRNEERIEQLNNFINEKRINEQAEDFEIKEQEKEESLKTIPSDEKYELTESNIIESLSSAIQVIMSDNDPSKDENEEIIRIPITSNVPVVSEGLKEMQPDAYFPCTPVSSIPQQYIFTEPKPNRNVVNEVTPPAFITSTAFSVPKRKAAFTIEDYLKSLTGTEHMKLVEKSNQEIEILLGLKNRTRETIMKIPLIKH
ncbi:hypothetical protein RclHR1_01800019 [Rhizophagus clarus]|uniref:BIR-domain-containing protein n=1 Tax=Rhizophagus clarus TaxID=94130 RepID=A0A2Z6R011_9GLOM|nr:hypothetical protein RclHR1_01800019 [Rhizophagus clarus]